MNCATSFKFFCCFICAGNDFFTGNQQCLIVSQRSTAGPICD
uniref:Uncharacterized protein n=1 Tax=Arundo donax TaxID=35708 RepID=A0A0A8ZZW0_ARUDO